MQSLRIASVILSFFCCVAMAQEHTSGALSFQDWKEQQILEAQNQMLRNSSRINLLKSGKPAGKDAKGTAPGNLPNSRVKKTAESADSISAAEKDLKRSQESLEAANGLELDDYISIYLPTLQDQPEALSKLSEKLSKEELAEIVKSLLKKGSKLSDAKHNGPQALEGLASSSRAKAL